MASKPERPSKSYKLENGEEVVMTYTIFNDIVRFVGSVDVAVQSILTSQDTRDVVLRRLLSDSKKQITDEKELLPVEEVDEKVDFFEIDDLLAWVMEHVTYFFMSQASSMQQRMERFPEMMKMMTSSNLSGNGSTN